MTFLQECPAHHLSFTPVLVILLLLLLSHFGRVRLLATPWTAAYQAPPMGFSRQEYWSGLPLPSPRPSLGVKKCFLEEEMLVLNFERGMGIIGGRNVQAGGRECEDTLR